MGLRMKNFDILGVYWKIRLLGVQFTKNRYRGGVGIILKRGAWTANLRGYGKKKEVVFLRGDWYSDAHYACASLDFQRETLFNKITSIDDAILAENKNRTVYTVISKTKVQISLTKCKIGNRHCSSKREI